MNPFALSPITRGQAREFDRIVRQWGTWGQSASTWAIGPGAFDPDHPEVLGRFLDSGERIWREASARAERVGLRTSGSTALDFGCGPGRFARALADRFASVLGLDVAPAMVALARRIEPPEERCRFEPWARPDLGGLPDGQFDLSFSAFVLQHLPSWLVERYVREMIRVTRPGGTIVLQHHGALALPGIRRLPAPVLELGNGLLRWMRLPGFRRRGPWPVSLLPPDELRRMVRAAPAELRATDPEGTPQGRMISCWSFLRRVPDPSNRGGPVVVGNPS